MGGERPVLIACSDEFVLSASARAPRPPRRGGLLSRVAAPEVGDRSAAVSRPPSRREWPSTKVQRCVPRVLPGQAADHHDEAGFRRRASSCTAWPRSCCIAETAQAEWWLEASGRGCGFGPISRSSAAWSTGARSTRTSGWRRARSGLVRLANAGTVHVPGLPRSAAGRAASGHEQHDRGGVNAQLDRCCASIGAHVSPRGQGGLCSGATCTSSIHRWRDTLRRDAH